MPVKIDFDTCVGCMNCVEVCPQNVYDENSKPVIARLDECVDCGICVEECPEGSITMI